MNYRMTAYLTGRILTVAAVTMLIPMLLSLYYNEGIASAYLIPIVIAVAIGLAVSVKAPSNRRVYAREGMAVVALSWILISLIGGLPFYISGAIPSLADCFFEAVSGFTTTGSSILTDVESMSKSLLFWRSFTHWLGGMGVLVFAMAIFSEKDTRTTYMMRAEMPGPVVGKIASKWQFSVRILYVIYIVLSVVLAVLLRIGGMSWFDSILHTFGTAGTGGFGIKSASVGYYDSAYIDYVIAIFMMLFGLNFNVYYLLLIRKFTQLGQSEEVKWYLLIMAAASVLIAVNITPLYNGFLNAFRYSYFQVSSVMTTTGYATADFTLWPMFSQMILVMLMFFGACAGSTGGGIKIVRVLILAKSAVHSVKKAISPRSVYTLKADGKRIGEDVVRGTLAYFVVYMIFMGISLLIVSLDNMDFTTTATAVISTMNNIGPGLGAVGPNGNFSGFSDLSKIVMSIDMLAGRLELYPILILLSPYMWKKS